MVATNKNLRTRRSLTGAELEASSVLVTALEKRFRTFCARRQDLSRRRTPETIHDLRVATRRLIAVIDVVNPIVESEQLRRSRRRLKRLLSSMNALRDSEILRRDLTPLARRFRALSPLLTGIRRTQRDLLSTASAGSSRIDLAELENSLAFAISALGTTLTQPGGREAMATLVRAGYASAYLRFVHDLSRIAVRNPDSFHRLRVGLKRLRYTCEVLRPLQIGPQRAEIRNMATLQTVLGDLQDLMVLQRAIQGYASNDARDPGGSLIQVFRLLDMRKSKAISEALLAIRGTHQGLPMDFPAF